MKSAIRIGNRVEQNYVMGLEQISGLEIDTKVIIGFVETPTEAEMVGGHRFVGHRTRTEKNPWVSPSAGVAPRPPTGAELGLELRRETCVAHYGCLVNFT